LAWKAELDNWAQRSALVEAPGPDRWGFWPGLLAGSKFLPVILACDSGPAWLLLGGVLAGNSGPAGWPGKPHKFLDFSPKLQRSGSKPAKKLKYKNK
jgi:hypothetical protein